MLIGDKCKLYTMCEPMYFEVVVNTRDLFQRSERWSTTLCFTVQTRK
jgi:hypothetical protein